MENSKLKTGIIILLTFSMLLFMHCGDGDEETPTIEKTPQDEVKVMLAGTWNIGSSGTVTRDGIDITSDLQDWVLTFGKDFSYTSSGGKEVWLDTSNGIWKYSSPDEQKAGSITIGDTEIDITVSQNSLIMKFTIQEGGSGIGARELGITGQFEVDVSK